MKNRGFALIALILFGWMGFAGAGVQLPVPLRDSETGLPFYAGGLTPGMDCASPYTMGLADRVCRAFGKSKALECRTRTNAELARELAAKGQRGEIPSIALKSDGSVKVDIPYHGGLVHFESVTCQ